ncbi:MAG TPA: DUF4232 domain-containing protein, partial [Acidimicrobiia bacterium]
RMRVQRRVMSGAAAVAIVAVGSLAIANLTSRGNGNGPAAPITTAGSSCPAPSTAADYPAWAASAHPPVSVPHLVSRDRNVVAVVFADPMRSGSPTDRSNKILWIVRLPRGGTPLEITATLPRSDAHPVHVTFPADSAPGEIYPSTVNVPAPGCWHFALSWNGHRSAVDLAYEPPVATTTSVPSPTVPVTTSTTPARPGPCRTADLVVTLSAPNGSAGHMNYEIGFRNAAPAASCFMTGYPGVAFLDGSGHQIGVPAQRNPLSYAPVTLAPGASAYAHLSVTNPSVLGGCAATPVQQLQVFPPNETAAATVGAAGITVCATQVGATIDPVLDHPLG